MTHPHASRRAANPGLDQLATQIRNDRKGRHPELVALEGLEQQLLTLFVQVGGQQVDPEQAGTTMLIIGQLLNDLVTKLPPDEQHRAPAIIVNLLRMIGQRLYTGDAPDNTLRCPFPLATGAPCKFEPKVSMGGTLTTVMQGHVALHHPGETWPPAEPEPPTHDELECEPDADEIVVAGDGLPGTMTVRDETGRYREVGISDALELRRGPDGSLVEVITPGRTDSEQCEHPKHARMQILGQERCSACGSTKTDGGWPLPPGVTVHEIPAQRDGADG